MKNNSLAVAIVAVAFLFPVQSFAETAKVGDVTWGFRTDKRLNDMTSLWEPKQIGILDKKTGITHITTITKVVCVLDECLYRTEYQGSKGKKQEMQVFDIEEIAPKNTGNKKISMGDKDVAENAKKLGIEKEKLKKALEDENEYQKLLREIQVKKEQQRRKEEEEKEKNKNNGTTGNGGGGGGGSNGGGGSHGGGGSNGGGGSHGGGGSNGGGGSHGGGGSSGSGGSHGGGGSSGSGGSHGGGGNGGSGSKKLENIYVNEDTGVISDTREGACSGTTSDGWGMRMTNNWDGRYKFCQVYEPDGSGGRALGSARINSYKVSSQEGDCGPGSNMTFGKKSNGTFSVVCTYKHNPKTESSTVGSTGSSSSTDKKDAESSSPNGSSAGGGGGGGRSGADHATTPDSGKQGGENSGGGGQDGTTGGSGGSGTTGGSGGSGTTGGSGGSGTTGGSGGSEMTGGSGTTGTTGGSGTSGTNGSGGGGGGQDSELPEMPDSPFGNGDGEPDWGGLKSNGDFGTFKPSSAFSTGGACPQDITLDFGQFGTHQLPMSYVCMAVEKLRYVFIFLAYFVSAMMVFRTVNSMKG
jgi:hypothetical protein